MTQELGRGSFFSPKHPLFACTRYKVTKLLRAIRFSLETIPCHRAPQSGFRPNRARAPRRIRNRRPRSLPRCPSLLVIHNGNCLDPDGQVFGKRAAINVRLSDPESPQVGRSPAAALPWQKSFSTVATRGSDGSSRVLAPKFQRSRPFQGCRVQEECMTNDPAWELGKREGSRAVRGSKSAVHMLVQAASSARQHPWVISSRSACFHSSSRWAPCLPTSTLTCLLLHRPVPSQIAWHRAVTTNLHDPGNLPSCQRHASIFRLSTSTCIKQRFLRCLSYSMFVAYLIPPPSNPIFFAPAPLALRDI
ncbi:hypothetical protein VTK26DRAFT_9488 [Humicola hyalothermophila]